MTEVVVDASVALKWFHAEGEAQVTEARRLLRSHRAGGGVNLAILDLTVYEIGNVLLLRHRGGPAAVAEALEALRRVGEPLTLSAAALADAAALSARHALSFCDAAYAAAAHERSAALATLDNELLAAGLGETPAALVERLDL